MGVIWTIVLGIAGSFLAGIIGQFIGWYKAGQGGKKEGHPIMFLSREKTKTFYLL